MSELATLDPVSRACAVFLGVALLTQGRRFFWLVVAFAGFVVGWVAAMRFGLDLPIPPVAVAAGAGVAAALVAVFVQRVAVMLAGVVLGALLGWWLVPLLLPHVAGWEWAVVVAGAVIGGAGAARLFAVALTVLSSAVGALVLVETSGLDGVVVLPLFAGLLLLGLLVQTRGEAKR